MSSIILLRMQFDTHIQNGKQISKGENFYWNWKRADRWSFIAL